MARITPTLAGGAQVCAFLDMLAFSEIGAALLVISDDGYNVLVGSTPTAPRLFPSYADHPHLLVDLPRLGIKSTAAGRYQFIAKTAAYLWAKLNLPDFGPVSQDRGAIELLRENNAIQAILDGGITAAVSIASAIVMDSQVWASLPGAGYGQHENKMLDLLKVYGAALARYVSPEDALRFMAKVL